MTEPGSDAEGPGTPPDITPAAPPPPVSDPVPPGSTQVLPEDRQTQRGSMRRSQWSPVPPGGTGEPGAAGRRLPGKPALLLGVAVAVVIALATGVVVRAETGGTPAAPSPSTGTGVLQPLATPPSGEAKPATPAASAPDAEYPQTRQTTGAVASHVQATDTAKAPLAAAGPLA